MPIRTITLVN